MQRQADRLWVKVPEFGGEPGTGRWQRIVDTGLDVAHYDYFRRTGHLPVHEGDKPPKERQDG